jgi:hypothetical protein
MIAYTPIYVLMKMPPHKKLLIPIHSEVKKKFPKLLKLVSMLVIINRTELTK